MRLGDLDALKEVLTIQKTDFLSKSDNTSIENDKLAYRLVATGIEHALDCVNIIPTVPQINLFCENADEKAIEDMKAELQSVLDSERQKGEWLQITPRIYKCSVCGRNIHAYDVDLGYYPFCHCGADMRKGDTK